MAIEPWHFLPWKKKLPEKKMKTMAAKSLNNFLWLEKNQSINKYKKQGAGGGEGSGRELRATLLSLTVASLMWGVSCRAPARTRCSPARKFWVWRRVCVAGVPLIRLRGREGGKVCEKGRDWRKGNRGGQWCGRVERIEQNERKWEVMMREGKGK